MWLEKLQVKEERFSVKKTNRAPVSAMVPLRVKMTQGLLENNNYTLRYKNNECKYVEN